MGHAGLAATEPDSGQLCIVDAFPARVQHKALAMDGCTYLELSSLHNCKPKETSFLYPMSQIFCYSNVKQTKKSP